MTFFYHHPAHDGNTDLDRRRSHRSAMWFYGTQRDRADGAPGESVFGPRLRFSWSAR
jgi:hypothetical protein